MAKTAEEVKDVGRDYSEQMAAIEKTKKCTGARIAKLALPDVQKGLDERREKASSRVTANPDDKNAIAELKAVEKYLDRIKKETIANNKILWDCLEGGTATAGEGGTATAGEGGTATEEK